MFYINLMNDVLLYILRRLQCGLNKYVTWGLENNMHVYDSKTKAMVLNPAVEYNQRRCMTYTSHC